MRWRFGEGACRFVRFGKIGFWKTYCGKPILCDHCNELRPTFDFQVIIKDAGPEGISSSVG